MFGHEFHLSVDFGLFLFVLVSVLLCGGFFTLFERKVMASAHSRVGPNKVIWVGLLQPLGDAFKLFFKSNVSSEVSMDLVYFFSPILSLFLSLLCWVVYPVGWGLSSWYSGILFVMFCFSVSVYGLIFSGLFSRSKFALLGCVRGISQSVSYEIPLSLGILVEMVMFSSVSLVDLINVQDLVQLIFPLFFVFVLMIVIMLAEMNRSPFDLAEGESELVSGFSIELGSTAFVLVFLSEYASLVWVCFLMFVMFMGGLELLVGMKMIMLMFLLVLVRSSVPRVRFDLVMTFCWCFSVPLMISFFLISGFLLFNQSQMEAYYC